MANGTIAFDTLQTSDSANTGTSKTINTSFLFNGSAKAWASTAKDGVADDTFNIGSISDLGTGSDNQFNFTTNMANSTYALTCCAYNASYGPRVAVPYTKTTSSYKALTFDPNDDALSSNENDTVVFGDLA